MAQNFKRRISLFPDSLTKFQNSIKKLNQINFAEKADIDTFNKKNILYEETPRKEKKVKLSLLDTPSIDKEKFRKISIYSPISFGDNYTPFNEEILDGNTPVIKKSSLFPNKKFKKIDFSKSEINNSENIMLNNNENNRQYFFSLYNDKEIYGKNDIVQKCKINNIDDNSDNDEIQSNKNLCLFELEEAFNYIKNNPKFFSSRINRKKSF